MAKKQKAKFICFGAAGEICIRTLISIGYCQPPYVKIPGAPKSTTSKGRLTNYVKAPVGTVTICLELANEEAGTHSSWDFEEVIPFNEEAIKLSAKLKWRRLKAEFKEWRKKYKITRTSLRDHEKSIGEIEFPKAQNKMLKKKKLTK